MIDPAPGASEAGRIRAYYADASWNPSPGRRWLVAERRLLVEQLARSMLTDLSSARVLDVGCGVGTDLLRWSQLGVPASGLFGTELIPARVQASREALPGAEVALVEGFEIPFADDSMDVVTASLVLSSVIDGGGREALLREMQRVTRPGGLIAVYDFRIRKPWNRSVRPVRRGELLSVLGPPRLERRLGPLLPVMDLALRLPDGVARAVIRQLPRTHALWAWQG